MKNRIKILKLLTVSGNILFILWIWYNAFDENFKGTLPEKASAFGLTILLMINILLINGNKLIKAWYQ